jgi:hypothetical protein
LTKFVSEERTNGSRPESFNLYWDLGSNYLILKDFLTFST